MMRTLRSLVIFTAVLALVLTWPAASLLAQSSAGSISGTVTDASGGALPGASVTAKNAKTGAARTAVSNAAGAFTFPLLAVGVYSVTADLTGFTSATKTGVELNVGGDVSLRFALVLSSVKTAVTVTEEAPLIETTRTQQSDVVNENYIANLPTNGRNFIDFVLTTPGVTKDPRLGDISFAGQRGTLEQPRDRRRRQQQHVLRPDARAAPARAARRTSSARTP